MPTLPKAVYFGRSFTAVCFLLLSIPLSVSQASDHRLDDQLVQEALDTLRLIVGTDLSADDQHWLRQQWTMESADHPEPVAAALEAFAVAYNDIKAGTDLMTLANLRNQVIDSSYCAPRQSSDPVTARQKSIFAPDSQVLAADCIAGAVVTPFDVKALAKSNAFVGELVGNPVDVAALEAELMNALMSHADDWSPEGWQRMLWAELRAAALQEFWASADQATRDQWTAAARETFQQSNHVGSTALSLEKTALKEIGAAQVIAENGKHRLHAWEMNAILDLFSFLSGATISPRERTEITSFFLTNFHENPTQTVENARFARHWLDQEYYFGKDPQTGRIRSWTPEEQLQKRNAMAAELFCINNNPNDPDGLRVVEILYRHDPVIDVDCANYYYITRESDQLLVDMDGWRLTRAALDAHRHAFELLFAIRFTEEERNWFDQASISDMQQGAVGLVQALDGFQQIVAEIKQNAKLGPHLNEQRREGMAILIYCTNINAGHPHERRLFEIIDQHDPIIYEDCDREMVYRESDLGGLVSIYNFFASLSGFPPLTDDQIEALSDQSRRDYEERGGTPHYLSHFAKFTYWWSNMPVDARYRAVAAMKRVVKSPDEIIRYAWDVNSLATFQLGKLALCDFQKRKLVFDTRVMEIKSRAIFTTNPYAGSPWVNPEDIFNGVEFYGIMAPFIQEQCGNVWK